MFTVSSPRPLILLAAAVAVYLASGIPQPAVAQAVPASAHAAPLVPAALAPAAPPAPHAHVMWNSVDGTMSLWTVGDDGSWTHKEYGPYPGWTARTLADGADGVTNILWTRASDGQVSLWKMDSAGRVSNAEYGPFPGWSTVALSRFAPGVGDGSGALTGAAGGDLFGLFPNPTVAVNAITHTKLALDAASLFQVSNGAMTNSGGNIGIGTIGPLNTLDVNGGINTHTESRFSLGAFTDPSLGNAYGLKVSNGLATDHLLVNGNATLSLQSKGGGQLVINSNPNDDSVYLERVRHFASAIV